MRFFKQHAHYEKFVRGILAIALLAQPMHLLLNESLRGERWSGEVGGEGRCGRREEVPSLIWTN